VKGSLGGGIIVGFCKKRIVEKNTNTPNLLS
jgi:hypothetical protein